MGNLNLVVRTFLPAVGSAVAERHGHNGFEVGSCRHEFWANHAALSEVAQQMAISDL
jgi:hypothetical protein